MDDSLPVIYRLDEWRLDVCPVSVANVVTESKPVNGSVQYV